VLLRALSLVESLGTSVSPPSLAFETPGGDGGLLSSAGSWYVVGVDVSEASTGAATGVGVVGRAAATGDTVVGTGNELVGGTATATVGAELDGMTSVGAKTGESCGGCVPLGTPEAAAGAAVAGTVATTPDT
jgi:hypothetical protein